MKSKKDLIKIFVKAKEKNARVIGILLNIKSYRYSEIIVNNRSNFDKKLEYYNATYDDNLKHKLDNKIYISDFAYAQNPKELFQKLNY